LIDLDLGLLRERCGPGYEGRAGVEDQTALQAVDADRQLCDAVLPRNLEDFLAARGASLAVALCGIVRDDGSRLAGVVTRWIERNPGFDRQHGIAELAELFIVARHPEIGDFPNSSMAVT
jgi:hypothetical protein